MRFYVQPGRELLCWPSADTGFLDPTEPFVPELVSDGTGVYFELRGWTGPLSVGWS